MKIAPILCGAAFAITLAPAAAQQQDRDWQSQVHPQVLASPGLYQSGAECAPDRAEAVWGRDNRLLGYACVRNPSHR
jgi:hypothetical protein